jgi:Prolyl oligopeptidase family
MNKTLYGLLIFFLGLTACSIVVQGIIRIQLGAQLFYLDSFSLWLLLTNIISFAGALLLFKYYHYRKYRLVFIAGFIAFTVNLCYAILVYIILEFHQLANYNLPVLFITLGTSIVYAVSLILPRPGKKGWLKIAGIFMLVIGLLYLSAIFWYLSFPGVENNNRFEKRVEWISLFASLIPVLFILHFLSELKNIQPDNTNSPRLQWLKNVSGVVGFVSFMFVLIPGILISAECHSSLYWAKRNFEKTTELAQLFEFRVFINSNGDSLLYRLLKPLDYDPAKKYPLVISLPYGGQPGTDTIRQIEGASAAEVLSEYSNRRNYPAFIFIPHCPPGGGWGGIPNYPTTDSLVFEAISSLETQFGIDAKRIYITGLSRGGYGTWNFICKRPDLFAAAIPVCGGGDPALASKAVDVAVWAFHGKNDKNVPVSGSRDMINAMRNAGGHPTYTEYPDEAHNIWNRVSITPGLWDWLFAQKRN